MKKKDIVEKFREFWGSLNDKEQDNLWRLMTALRGPDIGGEPLKIKTTGVVRRRLFGKAFIVPNATYSIVNNAGAYVANPRTKVKLAYSEITKQGGSHFACHLTQALGILEVNGYL